MECSGGGVGGSGGGGGGPAEPVLRSECVLTDNVKSNCHAELDSASVQRGIHSTLVLRLALNATARACCQKRGFARRALDSTQGKPCSVALLGLAFTMAEILLSLTIIGVVAAITLPSLTGNINERTWNTQRKALYARFSQAIALMPSLNGYGTLSEETSSGAGDAVDTAAETFITSGLSKVLKINNVCDSDHLEDCGIVSSINTTGSAVDLPLDWLELNSKMINASYAGLSLDSHSMINAKAAAFETQNGESLVVYYNPSCRGAEERLTAYIVSPLICANFIYDLNGSKGPNTVGKDVGFITALYSFDSNVVSPMPVYQTKTGYYDDAVKFCREQDDARLPNKEEAISLWVNKKFIPNISTMQFYTSSSPGSANRIIQLNGNAGVMGSVFKDETGDISAQCVKR